MNVLKLEALHKRTTGVIWISKLIRQI